MRKTFLVLALGLLVALPAAAQNTDIEALAGLQFNFGNPGARSLGMGGAFLGLADDASAAEANPAGLTILRKAEITLEGRNYEEQQIFSTSGTFPNIGRTSFSHHSQAVEVTFGSFVYPYKNFTFGAYYHQPLRNVGAGRDVAIESNPLTGQVTATVPNYYMPVNNPQGPVSKAECEDIRRNQNNFFACLEYTVLPFVSALDVQQRTYGLAGAYKMGKVSVGATLRYQTFTETALTYRFDPDTLQPTSVVAQGSSDIRGTDSVEATHDITYGVGVKVSFTDKISAGAVFKKGATYTAPTFIANDQTDNEFARVAETQFHMPDVYGVGVSVNPLPVLIVNLDAVHVQYSNLVDDFFSINQTIRDLGKAFYANDVTEIHLGGEYFFASAKIPFALRLGAWHDPAHSVEYRGPLNKPEYIADAILYPKGQDATHLSIGAGAAFKRFQVDAAYERSKHYRVGSISVVARF